MTQIDFIEPADAFSRVSKGSSLLICAYERDDKFQRLHLEGAIALSEFQSVAATLPKDRELIFY